MPIFFKKIIKKFVKITSLILVKIFNQISAGRYFLEQINKKINNLYREITHNNIKLKFFVPNRLNLFRAKTFSVKEPETLSWIDNFIDKTVFWDIGANVGIYSCYAAKKKNCKVYAFEPSVFNLEILSKNININGLNERITIFSLPISNKIKETNFNMSSIDSGGAISTFGETFKSDGSNLDKVFSYKILGLSLDDAFQKLGLEKPNYIKIDVDGIEHLIISGGQEVLKTVEEILIEVDEKFLTQTTEVKKILLSYGFELKSKNQSKMMQQASKENKTYNQIWKRK